jgi:hypothetical protein
MKIKDDEIDALLDAHLQKEEKIAIYKPRVKANILNGNPIFQATWSWWAFFGGCAFFLYRKMYMLAGIFLILTVLIGTILPGGELLISIIAGVTGFHFYTKKFYSDLSTAQYGQKDLSEVKQDLRKLGGYHSWVIWVTILSYTILIGGIITYFYLIESILSIR